MTIQPFANLDHQRLWEQVNCRFCTKFSLNAGKLVCPWEEEILIAHFDGGQMDPDVAYRIGSIDLAGNLKTTQTWQCRDRTLTAEATAALNAYRSAS